MNILNQSITPNGQPAFLSKGSGSQDVAQCVPMALPLHGTHPLKSFQPSSLKTTLPAIATGDSSQGGSLCEVSADGFKSQSQISALEGSINGICNLSEFNPCTLSFPRSLMEDEKLDLLKGGIRKLDHTSRLNYVLVVTVSSAVKLDAKQIDLISRKMQRLTGFRNLRLENIIDPSLIAGFVISYDSDGSHIIDLSVKGQLAALAAQVESSDQRIAKSWSSPSHKS